MIRKLNLEVKSIEPFIADYGKSIPVKNTETGKIDFNIPRYSVWVYDTAKKSHQIVDNSDNLNALIKKYNVDPLRVVKV